MPRGKKNHFALAEDGNGGLAPVRIGDGGDGVSAVSGVQAAEQRAETAALALAWIVQRRDGWLRVAGGDTEKLNYWKFKFSSGPHRGKYVMYVAGVGNWSEGVLGLVDKLDEVDAGTRNPVVDTFYDPR